MKLNKFEQICRLMEISLPEAMMVGACAFPSFEGAAGGHPTMAGARRIVFAASVSSPI
jgi:hypothetical protein